jgi:hypothetical protein
VLEEFLSGQEFFRILLLYFFHSRFHVFRVPLNSLALRDGISAGWPG